MSDVQQFVDGEITDHKIVIFSETYCPFCKETKDYFASQYPKESVKVIELDKRNDCNSIQDYLKKKTGARSVPRTFISGEIVGGNDDLHALKKEKVDALIAKRA